MSPTEMPDFSAQSLALAPADERKARAYIDAIVRRGLLEMASVGDDHASRRDSDETEWLWQRFRGAYAAVSEGPYRKSGPTALQAALRTI